MNRVEKLTRHLLVSAGSSQSVCKQSAASSRKGLLEDHVTIITGSGQGIGEAAALLFAEEGSKVVVTDIDAKKI
jgi:3-oxoacyl-[acyl-carrier protein] reductase